MKKTKKRLVLARETLRTLNAPKLTDVYGGISDLSDCQSTVPSRCGGGCSGAVRCFGLTYICE